MFLYRIRSVETGCSSAAFTWYRSHRKTFNIREMRAGKLLRRGETLPEIRIFPKISVFPIKSEYHTIAEQCMGYRYYVTTNSACAMTLYYR